MADTVAVAVSQLLCQKGRLEEQVSIFGQY